jgi:hypothetical protein
VCSNLVFKIKTFHKDIKFDKRNNSVSQGYTFKKPLEAGMVIHACNPSCSEVTDLEDRGSRSLGKSLARPHINQQVLYCGMCLLS